MNINRFIAAQQEVIAESGLDEYLPTLWVETRSAVRVAVLEEAPSDGEVERLAKEWALHATKPREDYLLAFRADDRQFKVISRIAGATSERLVPVQAKSLRTTKPGRARRSTK